MADVPSWQDHKPYELSSLASAGFPRGPSGAGLMPAADYTDQGVALGFVGLLALLLLFLVVRCVRILLDPYSSMPVASWTNGPKDSLDRGPFDNALV